MHITGSYTLQESFRKSWDIPSHCAISAHTCLRWSINTRWSETQSPLSQSSLKLGWDSRGIAVKLIWIRHKPLGMACVACEPLCPQPVITPVVWVFLGWNCQRFSKEWGDFQKLSSVHKAYIGASISNRGNRSHCKWVDDQWAELEMWCSYFSCCVASENTHYVFQLHIYDNPGPFSLLKGLKGVGFHLQFPGK